MIRGHLRYDQWIKPTLGLLQGCPASPLLLAVLMKIWQHNVLQAIAPEPLPEPVPAPAPPPGPAARAPAPEAAPVRDVDLTIYLEDITSWCHEQRDQKLVGCW